MDFNVESLPYLFHIKFTDSWTHRSKGVFIDSDGIEYRYEDTNGWKSFYETNEIDFNRTLDFEVEAPPSISEVEIKPEVLFHNLSLCRKKKPFMLLSRIDKLMLSVEIIEGLMNSPMVYTNNEVVYDAPTTTYSLLVYDVANACYRQIHLNSTGYRNVQNNSVYTQRILQKFQKYRVS
ncbi:hypothetical protein [Pedobacter helvus]|uniref:Uncharacterized protein n=1 Tax=Pedobacter helvus TaxID=2563444 RepID=A0ABW9JEJ6_9SPHI|nr:hypothetical protein [Pedobacter ureilyticus]